MNLDSPPVENKPKQSSNNDKKFQSQKSMGAGSKFFIASF